MAKIDKLSGVVLQTRDGLTDQQGTREEHPDAGQDQNDHEEFHIVPELPEISPAQPVELFHFLVHKNAEEKYNEEFADDEKRLETTTEGKEASYFEIGKEKDTICGEEFHQQRHDTEKIDNRIVGRDFDNDRAGLRVDPGIALQGFDYFSRVLPRVTQVCHKTSSTVCRHIT